MIGAILRRDWRLLWPFVALLTVIEVSLQWALHRYGFFGDDVAAKQLVGPLTVAWFAGACGLTVVLVQHDAVPALDQDWLIRPIARTDLLLAKVLFVVLAICVPMLVMDVVRALATGFGFGAALTEAIIKEALVAAWLLVPVLAFATIASNATELLILASAFIGVYALGLSASALAVGAAGCPTCDTGLNWWQHLLQHAEVLLAAAVILILQYYFRQTRWSRALVLFGALSLALAQVPWTMAFALQSRLAPVPGAGTDVVLSFHPEAAADAHDAERAPAMPGPRALLPRGVGAYLERRAARTAAVRIDLPMQITGIASDQLLLIDRTRFELSGGAGGEYRGVNIGAFHDRDPRQVRAVRIGEQTLYVPAQAVPAGGTVPSRLRLEYFLTLMRVVTRAQIPAQDGEWQTEAVGHCATRLDEGATYIFLRCRQIGRTPFCLSATLYGADGHHDPEVTRCDPDYRPDLPSLTDLVRFYGLDIPLRGADLPSRPWTAEDLAQAHLQVEIYGIADHFTRTLVIPEIRLADWRR
jgi:hypothetical protein